jgi:hypothetical protein
LSNIQAEEKSNIDCILKTVQIDMKSLGIEKEYRKRVEERLGAQINYHTRDIIDAGTKVPPTLFDQHFRIIRNISDAAELFEGILFSLSSGCSSSEVDGGQ